MQLTSYLFFRDQSKAAFEHYAKCLDGEVMNQVTFGEMPDGPPVDEAAKDLIANICMKVGDSMLMASDCPPGMPFEPMQGCAVAIDAHDAQHAERIFAALGEGGEVTMPIQETSWAERFGMLTDRFGTRWMVNCNKPE
jgi:PhnB protein